MLCRRHSQISFGFFILLLIISPIYIQADMPEPSPAGGEYLTLEDDNDFVSTIKPWFPKESFEQLTIEAWIYIEAPPEPDTYWCLFGQEGRFEFVILSFQVELVAPDFQGGAIGNHVWSGNANCLFAVGTMPTKLWQNRWVHIFASYNAAVGWGMDGRGSNGARQGYTLMSNKPFRIGGLIPSARFHFFAEKNVTLRGYIDEVRISDVIRYDGIYEEPIGQFKPDRHTIGLWHFDGKDAFRDESGNDYTLWKNETYSVQGRSRLSTTWGMLKRK